MRRHAVLTLGTLLGLGTAAGLASAAFLVAPLTDGVEIISAISEPQEQSTVAEALSQPGPEGRSGDREFAAKLLAARQENAQRQYEGQPAVWMFLPAAPHSERAEPAKPAVTRTHSLSAL
jgi:hypothetical protein